MIQVMTNQETKRIAIVGAEDDGVMARTTFDIDMDIDKAKRLHRDLGEALKLFKE